MNHVKSFVDPLAQFVFSAKTLFVSEVLYVRSTVFYMFQGFVGCPVGAGHPKSCGPPRRVPWSGPSEVFRTTRYEDGSLIL